MTHTRVFGVFYFGAGRLQHLVHEPRVTNRYRLVIIAMKDPDRKFLTIYRYLLRIAATANRKGCRKEFGFSPQQFKRTHAAHG
jgi:hypothetical protein